VVYGGSRARTAQKRITLTHSSVKFENSYKLGKQSKVKLIGKEEV